MTNFNQRGVILQDAGNKLGLRAFRTRVLICAFMIFHIPFEAHAYVGPGAGLGAIAVAVAILLGLVLLVAGFLWYPLKRLLREKRAKSGKDTTASVDD